MNRAVTTPNVDGRKRRKRECEAMIPCEPHTHINSDKEEDEALFTKTVDSQALPEYRDCRSLYAAFDTIDCASQALCVPCAYKIGTFDCSLDKEFTNRVPNTRPENCPRTSLGSDTHNQGKQGSMGFRRGMDVLTVGDGDLTFSLAVARIIMPNGGTPAGNIQSGRLVATSYESHQVISGIYPSLGDTVKELVSLGSLVYYEVDATDLCNVLIGKAPLKFDRIVWNFPCSAVSSGQDGQNSAMEINKELIRNFVKNAVPLLREGGEIHMAHKTKPPFNHWEIEKVASEGLKKQQTDYDGKNKPKANSMEYKGRIVFDKCCLPPYTPRKALDKKSFTCHDACVYVFGLKCVALQAFPPTIPPVSCIVDAETKIMKILPVTKGMLMQLRKSILDHSLHTRNEDRGAKGRKKKSRR